MLSTNREGTSSTMTSGAYDKSDEDCKPDINNSEDIEMHDEEIIPADENKNMESCHDDDIEHCNSDIEDEDEFGYTACKVQKKYAHLAHPIFLFTLTKKWYHGLGISLCGDKNLLKKAVYVNDLHPEGPTYQNQQLQPGDQILEVNGITLENVDFPTAAWLISSMDSEVFKFVIVRDPSAFYRCHLKESSYFPNKFQILDFEKFIKNIKIQKNYNRIGLSGQAIYDEDVGWVFKVTGIEEGGPAERAGVKLEDVLLAVNGISVIGMPFHQIPLLLASQSEEINLIMCDFDNGKRHFNKKMLESSEIRDKNTIAVYVESMQENRKAIEVQQIYHHERMEVDKKSELNISSGISPVSENESQPGPSGIQNLLHSAYEEYMNQLKEA